jgi:acyl CoA:acetate/3-ketoacid CoA transferase alpha subunit
MTRAGLAELAAMVAEASRGVETRARKRKRDFDAQAGVAIPGLPFDVAVSLVEKHLPDPADLAVLRA